ncbi:MAG: repeat, subfamily [Chthonomonadaceae bacterium]|nr:repeat, subfamily [Chthonomonadaceae bacterium]
MCNQRGICATIRREFETLWLFWPVGEAEKCSVPPARWPARLLTPVLMATCGWGSMRSPAAQDATSPTARLVKAMQENNLQAAQEALNQGAPPYTEVDGTPLPFVAAWRGRTGILKALLDHGVRSDICTEVDHTSLLIRATHMGDPSIIRMLLDHKAPVNVRNDMGETALTVVRNPDPPQAPTRAVVMRMLLHAGADPEIRDGEGRTAIMRYATFGISDAVEVLAGAGVKVNARDHDGNTALILAAGWRNGDTGVMSPEACLAIVKRLLKQGADLRARNHDGRTALIAAREAKHPEIVSLLREHGATGE